VYGHPAPETLERLQDAGSEYYITSECGMITVNYDGKDTINVRKYKE
jgi:beta-lactamase superfamily II metal-dependent hydrolase